MKATVCANKRSSMYTCLRNNVKMIYINPRLMGQPYPTAGQLLLIDAQPTAHSPKVQSKSGYVLGVANHSCRVTGRFIYE